MRRLIIFSLLFLLLPLAGCYSKSDVDDAYLSGYEAGKQDAMDTISEPTPAPAPMQESSPLYVGHDEPCYYLCAVYGIACQEILDGVKFYHLRGCLLRFQGPYGGESWFHTAEEAEAAGYEPCPICIGGLDINYPP